MTAPRLVPLVPPVVLLGPPGVGKSTVGRALAAHLGFGFIDLDERAGADRFTVDGELRFRLREHLALARALTEASVVIAAGAGIVDVDENAPLLQRALLLHLHAPADVCLTRLQKSPRPWLPLVPDPAPSPSGGRLGGGLGPASSSAWPAIYAAREGKRPQTRTELAGAAVDASAPVDDVVVALVNAIRRWRLPHQADHADANDVSHVLQLDDPTFTGRSFVIADAAVAARLPRTDLVLALSPGDKRLATVEAILSVLVREGVRRSDMVVAVGGGVLLDVVGLSAALHHRGTSWRAVPTTLLAMVDAGIGGKTAVDVLVDGAVTRNAAGVIHAPRSTCVWPGFLETNDDDLRRHGRAEMLKHALLWGAGDLEDAIAVDATAIARSRGYKQAVVGRDLHEAHLRHALNLGHTVGHALESVLGIPHGDAVLHGLRAALWLSVEVAGLDVDVAVRARAVIDGLTPPSLPPLGADVVDTLVAACGRDKKGDTSGIRFVLLQAPGAPVFATVPASVVRQAIWSLSTTTPP